MEVLFLHFFYYDAEISLFPVLVGLDMLGVGGGVVEAGGVEHLELLVGEAVHRLHRVFLLRPVDVVTFDGKPANEDRDGVAHNDNFNYFPLSSKSSNFDNNADDNNLTCHSMLRQR